MPMASRCPGDGIDPQHLGCGHVSRAPSFGVAHRDPPSLTAPPLRRADFELRPFLERSDAIAAWQILNTLGPLAALWPVALWALAHQVALVPPVLALQMLFLARCFSLMHDCGHGALFRDRRTNRAVGFLLGMVAGIPQLPWSRGHAYHHRHNGDWQLYQGPSALISTDAYAALSPANQRLYRWLRHPLMLLPGGFFYLVIKPRLALLLGGLDLLRGRPSRHWYTPAEGWDLLANNLVVVASWLLMGALMGHGRFWSLYAPLMTGAAALFICVFFVQHNFPASYAHRTEGWSPMAGVLEGTSDLDLPPLLHWFTADIGCHAMHHLCEAIPNYRLRAAHERNAPLLQAVRRLRLADIPGCFNYILWDPQAARLTTPALALIAAPGSVASAP